MKKIVSIIILVLLLAVQPVFASKPSDVGNGNGNQSQENHGSVRSAQVRQDNNSHEDQQNETANENSSTEEPSTSPSPTDSPSPDVDDEDGVGSPVAQEVVSEDACDPNTQWKNHGEYVSCVAQTHPGGQVVSEAARSDIGKKETSEPSVTPTPTDTPPITSAVATVEDGFSPLASLGALIGKALGLLKHLLN